MDEAKAREQIHAAQDCLDAALHYLDDSPTPIPPIPPTGITTADQLDRALAAAQPFDVLELDPSLVYQGPLLLSKPVTLRTANIPVGLVPMDLPLPRFLGGISWATDSIVLSGADVRHYDPTTNIMAITGAGWLLDRVRIIGDPKQGAKRGVACEPLGRCRITSSVIDDCFRPSPGDDAQAIALWNGTDLLIDDNFLRAGSETILLGGADSRSSVSMPSFVTIRGNMITARPEWQGQAIGVKTRLELKACRNVLVEDNDVQYAWRQGQVGYLLTLTVRNQDGHAPWSTIEDVIVRNNRFAHGCSAISILGRDNNYPSGQMARVTIDDNDFADLDAAKYEGGSDKLIQIIDGLNDSSISGNRFTAAHVSSLIYFDGTKSSNLKVCNNTWPAGSDYQIFGTRGTPGNPGAWPEFVEAGELSGNVEV